MINVLFLIGLLALITSLGTLMTGLKKPKIKCSQLEDTFTIVYRRRTIYVTATLKDRIPSYIRKGDYEFITLPVGAGSESVKRAEHFVSRAKTTYLVRYLFDFSNIKEPIWLFQYDPENAKALSEIQWKLLSFIRKY